MSEPKRIYGTVLGSAEEDDWSTGYHAVRRYWTVVDEEGNLFKFLFDFHPTLQNDEKVEIRWTGVRYELVRLRNAA